MLRTYQQLTPSKSSILVDQLLHRRLYYVSLSYFSISFLLSVFITDSVNWNPFLLNSTLLFFLSLVQAVGGKAMQLWWNHFAMTFTRVVNPSFLTFSKHFSISLEKQKRVIKSLDRKKQQRLTANLTLLVCAFPYQKRHNIEKQPRIKMFQQPPKRTSNKTKKNWDKLIEFEKVLAQFCSKLKFMGWLSLKLFARFARALQFRMGRRTNVTAWF